jgi:hypothetical protein
VFILWGSVRRVGAVAGIAVLVLGLTAGSALAWKKCKDNGGKDQTSTVPTSSSGSSGDSEKSDHDQKYGEKPSGGESSDTGKKPGEETQQAPAPVVPAPVVASTPAPVATELLPAPQPAVAVSPAPTPAPETPSAATPAPVVKGEIGTAYNSPGGQVPTVLAAVGTVGQSSGESGGLARTGFGLLPLAMLGGLALGGSAFFFPRFQGC